MAQLQSMKNSTVTVEDFVAFNDELAALVRAGVPLESGLHQLGVGLHGGLGRLSQRIAQRMSDGSSLDEALRAEGAACPRVYRAVLETGLRSGRLPEALEALNRFARSFLDLRQRVGMALVYPTIVLAVAYGLFVVFSIFMVPYLESAFRSLELPVHRWLLLFGSLNDTVLIWAPLVPFLVVFVAVYWKMSRRWLLGSGEVDVPRARGRNLLALISWIPGIRGILTNFHRAGFSHMLALLVERGVPLEESMRLAANVTGSKRLIVASERIADRLKGGCSLGESLQNERDLPPFMRWMMSAGERQGTLPQSLVQLADIYQRRAMHQAEWFKLLVPILLIVVVGGGTTLLYSLTLFYPLAEMLKDLNVG